MTIRFVALIVALLATPTYAQTLKQQKEALDVIKEFADDFCKEIQTSGFNSSFNAQSKSSAEVSNTARKLFDLGFESTAKYAVERYAGLPKEDFAKALQDNNSCRMKVWTDLNNRLIGAVAMRPPTNVKKREPVIGRDDTMANVDEPDESRATILLRKLSALENGQAELKISELYADGSDGFPKSNNQSLKWLKRAAERGNPKAQLQIGKIYETGKNNVLRNEVIALHWYRRAAESGYAAAQSALGEMYESGRGGLVQSTSEANTWYAKAAAQKFPRAISLLAQTYAQEAGGAKLSVATEMLSQAAELNDPLAQLLLGRMHEHGIGMPADDVQASRFYRKAANAGDMDALVEIGRFYEFGKGGQSVNSVEALRLYQQAADGGNPRGIFRVAWMHFIGGGGLPKNDRKAFDLFLAAAKMGDGCAQDDIGDFYVGKKGLPNEIYKNLAEGVRWFKRSAEQGNAFGQFDLGLIYKEGIGVEQDYAQALYWLKKAAEADSFWKVDWDKISPAIPGAQFNIGHIYITGKGLKIDGDVEAVKWFRLAAEKNHLGALDWLGWMHENGKGGLAKSDSEAAKYYLRAAEREHASSQYKLGVLYRYGKGVEQNNERAMYWFSKAAKANYGSALNELGWIHQNGIVGQPINNNLALKYYQQGTNLKDDSAENNLGFFYEKGMGGLKINNEEAFKLYRRAAIQNNPSAQANLAQLYYDGRGVNADDRQAFEWFERAAINGNAFSQNMVGRMYESGRGVTSSPGEAANWYKKAAEQNFESAQNNLANLYLSGNGVSVNLEEAVRLYKLAASKNISNAQYNLAVMYLNGNEYVKKDISEGMKLLSAAARQGDQRAQSDMSARGQKW